MTVEIPNLASSSLPQKSKKQTLKDILAIVLAIAVITSTIIAWAWVWLPLEPQSQSPPPPPTPQFWWIFILADGSIDQPRALVSTFDKVTYTFTDNIINCSIGVERDNIVIDGAGFTLQGTRTWGCSGINLRNRTNVTVQNTQISDFANGILLSRSMSNSIIGNNITTNFNGITIDDLGASFNRFYHNNFINNTVQTNFISSSLSSVWDSGFPSGGNYWSDYTGVDADGDGIGDTPYIIDELNRDNYPLVNPYKY